MKLSKKLDKSNWVDSGGSVLLATTSSGSDLTDIVLTRGLKVDLAKLAISSPSVSLQSDEMFHSSMTLSWWWQKDGDGVDKTNLSILKEKCILVIILKEFYIKINYLF